MAFEPEYHNRAVARILGGMKLIVTIELVLFVLITFGLRSFLQWRSTGKTGFVGLRPGAGPLERSAGIAMLVALVLGPVAPWVGTPMWVGGESLGVVIAAIGIALTFLAQVTMGESWRIGVDSSESTELVTSGVFAIVRNPIFSAMVLVSIGLVMAVPTPLAVPLPFVLFLALELQVRLVEEPYLVQVHGARYRDWASRTGRFVPMFGRLR